MILLVNLYKKVDIMAKIDIGNLSLDANLLGGEGSFLSELDRVEAQQIIGGKKSSKSKSGSGSGSSGGRRRRRRRGSSSSGGYGYGYGYGYGHGCGYFGGYLGCRSGC
jgi:hypothetical protein